MDLSYDVELISTYPDGWQTEDDVSVSLSNAPDIERRIAKARHKNTCNEMKAQLNQCQECSKMFLHFDMVQNSLCIWMKRATPLPSIDKKAAWPSKQQLDIAAYT